jgi:DNA-directed RNA polymerase subunit RPC12/RpoP
MVIITKRGSIGANEDKIKYYKGKCVVCESEFYFSSLDINSEKRLNGAKYINCPVCHRAIVLKPSIFSTGIEEISKEEYMKLVPEKIEK